MHEKTIAGAIQKLEDDVAAGCGIKGWHVGEDSQKVP